MFKLTQFTVYRLFCDLLESEVFASTKELKCLSSPYKVCKYRGFCFEISNCVAKNEQKAFPMIFVSVIADDYMINRFGVSSCLLG